MVTPTYATFVFNGKKTGKNYHIQGYIADVANTPTKFDSGSGASATSLPFWRVPEPCELIDLSIVTGPTVTTSLIPTVNGAQVSGIRWTYTMFLSTLAFRPRPSLYFAEGSNFGSIEQ
jgi:hypothetical protein